MKNYQKILGDVQVLEPLKKVLYILLSALIFNSSCDQKADLFDQLQENVWYLPTDDGQTKLYITQLGVGDTIVTLHGGPGNNFIYLVDAVKGNIESNTLILFDQRGSILSPVNDSLTSQLSLDILVEDLETIRKTLRQDKITLFGHSFGTLLAFSYYIKYPEHVKGLILTATMPPYVTNEKPFRETLKEIHSRIKEVRKRPEVTTALEKAGLSNDTLLTPKQKSDRFKITGLASFNMYDISNWKKFKGGGVYYTRAVDNAIGATIPSTYDIRPALDGFPVPITIIQGDKDYIDPAGAYWSSILKNYPNVNLKVIKNASHYSWMDDKKAFDENLKQAIKTIQKN